MAVQLIRNMFAWIKKPRKSNPRDIMCLCDSIKPILKFGQIIGICPMVWKHPTPTVLSVTEPFVIKTRTHYNTIGLLDQQVTLRQHQCYLSTNWISIPSIINIFLSLSFITITFWVILNINLVLKGIRNKSMKLKSC